MRRTVPVFLLVLLALLVQACGSPSPASPTTPTTPTTPTAPAAPTATTASAQTIATPTAENSANNADNSGNAGSAGNAALPRPGIIEGKATTEAGEPLTGVTIVIRGTTGAGENTYFETEVDEQGRYEQAVPVGVYKVTAYVTTSYDDQTYNLWLHPTDNNNKPNNDANKGVIKDFVWKMSGLTPDGRKDPSAAGSYYGGAISVGGLASYKMYYGNGELVDEPDFPAGSVVVLTLTPAGALMDGSGAKTLTYEIEPRKLPTTVVKDVPLGRYSASAVLKEADGTSTELQVASFIPGSAYGTKPQPGASALITFVRARMGDYGLEPVNLYILP